MNIRIGLIILLVGVLKVSTGLCQTDSRILEISKLYKDYNEKIPDMDSYEIKYNTPGSEPSLTIYNDFSGKILIKADDADEFGSSYSEYYYKNDTIQFIYFKSERLIDHWGADTVKVRNNEVRIYFSRGEVIKTLKKELIAIEGKESKVDLAKLPNVETDYKTDKSVNWMFYREMISKLSGLAKSLDETF